MLLDCDYWKRRKVAAAVDMSKSGLGNDFGCKLVGYSAFSLSSLSLTSLSLFLAILDQPKYYLDIKGVALGRAGIGRSYYTCLAAAFCRLAADGGVFRTAVSGRKSTTKPPKMLAAVNSAMSRWPSNLFCNGYIEDNRLVYWPT